MRPKFKGWYPERTISSLPPAPQFSPHSPFQGEQFPWALPKYVCPQILGGTLGISSYLEMLELGNPDRLPGGGGGQEEAQFELGPPLPPKRGRISAVKEQKGFSRHEEQCVQRSRGSKQCASLGYNNGGSPLE